MTEAVSRWLCMDEGIWRRRRGRRSRSKRRCVRQGLNSRVWAFITFDDSARNAETVEMNAMELSGTLDR